MVRKSAFTLIELIFAIVIIAISVISLPRMIQTTSDGIEGNLVQEAIFVASTELNQAVTANWDENSTVESPLARVIDSNGTSCENNSSDPRYRLRKGHIAQAKHRRCLADNTIGIARTSATAVDALEDYAGTRLLQNNATGTASGYKTTYQTVVTVTPNAVFNGAGNADIKMIQVNTSKVEDGVTTLITSLRTYSANIGEVDYSERMY